MLEEVVVVTFPNLIHIHLEYQFEKRSGSSDARKFVPAPLVPCFKSDINVKIEQDMVDISSFIKQMYFIFNQVHTLSLHLFRMIKYRQRFHFISSHLGYALLYIMSNRSNLEDDGTLPWCPHVIHMLAYWWLVA